MYSCAIKFKQIISEQGRGQGAVLHWVRTSMTSYVQNLHRNSTSEFRKNSCFFTDRHKICEKSTQEVYQGIFCTQEVNLGIPMCCMVEFLCEFLCTKCTQEVIDVGSHYCKAQGTGPYNMNEFSENEYLAVGGRGDWLWKTDPGTEGHVGIQLA